MTVAKMKTKVEQELAEQFTTVSGNLPGDASVQGARKAAIETFDTQGLPHRRIEEWKYTDLRNIVQNALPLKVGDATEVTIAEVVVAVGRDPVRAGMYRGFGNRDYLAKEIRVVRIVDTALLGRAFRLDDIAGVTSGVIVAIFRSDAILGF